MHVRSASLVGLALALSLSAATGAAVAAVAAGATNRFVLDNGLTVLLREERAAPIVTMQVWVKTGSATEGSLLGSGVSHFVEHMLFKGSKNMKPGEYAQKIHSFGGDINAYTTYDRTVYFFTIASAYYDQGLAALAEVVQNATFPAAETAREQEVIRREIAMTADLPSSQLWQTMAATSFLVHPYRHPISGYLEAFSALTRDDLVSYYRRRYVPNNAVLVIVGDFDAAQARAGIQETFGGWPRRVLEPANLPIEPASIAPRRAVRPFKVEKTQVMVAWRGTRTSHPDVFACDVLSIVAGSGKDSRLWKRLKERDQLVHSVGTSNWNETEDGLFLARMELDQDKLEPALAALEDEVNALRERPIEPQELERAKALVVASKVRHAETVEDLADGLGSGELGVGDPDFSDYYVEQVRRVTAAQVQAAARTYLVPERRSTVALEPEPRTTDAASAAPAASTTAPQRAMGLRAENVNVVTATLPNGLRLLVMPRPRLPLVAMAADFLAGQRYESGYPAGVAAFVREMLDRGTTTRTAEQLAASVEAVGGELDCVSDTDVAGARVIVLKEHLGLGLDVFCDVLTSCSFPAAEVEKVRATQLAAVATERDQPFRAAGLDLARLRYGDHPWGRSANGTEESLKAMTREQLVQFYEAAYAPAGSVLTVVGDVDPSAIVAELTRRLAGFIRPRKVAPPPAVPFVKGIVKEVVPTPGRQQAVIFMGWEGCTADSPDRYPLEVLNGVLNGLDNRLFDRLRNQKSLAYQVGSALGLGGDKRSQLFYIGTRPDRVQEAVSGLLAEAKAVREAPVTAAELERSKNTLIGSFAIDLQTNRSLAASMAYNEIMGLGYLHSFQSAGKVAAVTAAQVKAAARSYLNPDRYVLAILAPPAAASAEPTRTTTK